jgi:hypothetical protein
VTAHPHLLSAAVLLLVSVLFVPAPTGHLQAQAAVTVPPAEIAPARYHTFPPCASWRPSSRRGSRNG